MAFNYEPVELPDKKVYTGEHEKLQNSRQFSLTPNTYKILETGIEKNVSTGRSEFRIRLIKWPGEYYSGEPSYISITKKHYDWCIKIGDREMYCKDIKPDSEESYFYEDKYLRIYMHECDPARALYGSLEFTFETPQNIIYMKKATFNAMLKLKYQVQHEYEKYLMEKIFDTYIEQIRVRIWDGSYTLSTLLHGFVKNNTPNNTIFK